ncbi:MAG: helix-turn-helix transcriptional regulator, partial [Rubrobacteraceae bacterium]
EVRLERGMSQQDLAKLSGITVCTISGHEVGRHGARLGTAQKLAAALGTTVEDLRKVEKEKV